MKDAGREAFSGAAWLIVLAYSIWAAMNEGRWHAAMAALALVLVVLNLWPVVSRRRRNRRTL